MEKILIAIDGRHEAWEAITHACSLAKRVDVLLDILLVLPDHRRSRSSQANVDEAQVRQQVELYVEAAKAEGVTVNFFIAEGSFEEEVITFINNNKINLLLCQPHGGEGRSTGRDMAALRSLQHRIACKMAIVAPKRTTTIE